MMCVCCADIMESGLCACADWHTTAKTFELLMAMGRTLSADGAVYDEHRKECEQDSFHCVSCGEYIAGTSVWYEYTTPMEQGEL